MPAAVKQWPILSSSAPSRVKPGRRTTRSSRFAVTAAPARSRACPPASYGRVPYSADRLGGARRLKRVPDFVGRRRHVDMGDAERTQRIENCADHGRRCAGRPGFAGALEELVINLKTPAQSI